jgi:hypothetical protein
MSISKLLIAAAINNRQYRLKKGSFVKRHLPNDLHKIVGNKRRYIEGK